MPIQPVFFSFTRDFCVKSRLVCSLVAIVLTGSLSQAADPTSAAGPELDFKAYFAEPKNLPYDEEIQEKKQEDGWHWTEFRYTSIIHDGEPTRVHAVYAVPDGVDAAHPAPAILMTHGVFGAVMGDPRYWDAVKQYVKAGYVVFFFDWYPNFARDFKPKTPDEPKRFTTYGKLDYFTPAANNLPGHDWKDSQPYQVAMAAKRAVSWLLAHPEVDGKRIGVTGWSYGGIYSSMIAGIDDRIAAANPCVYTSRFGPKEESYNLLNTPPFKDPETVKLWRSRFDSFTLLAQRSVPILYTVGANDEVFSVVKAAEVFAAMREPKYFLIGPNEGHGYWAVKQGILFFDTVLKKTGAYPVISDLTAKVVGSEVVASVKVTGAVQGVEFFVAPTFERDPINGWSIIPAQSWKWTDLKATKAAGDRYEVRYPLPVMHPPNPKETLYRWKDGDTFDPATLPAAASSQPQGAIQLFARVTDDRGAMECSTLAQPVIFSDKAAASPAVAHALPKFLGAARVKQKISLDLKPDGATTLDLPLPSKTVGQGGYILWNWRKEVPSAGAATKTIRAPFEDSIKADSFTGFKGNLPADFAARGKMNFRINGQEGLAEKADGWHGSVSPGMGAEEINLQPKDSAEHRATLVMVGGLGECHIRISLRAADGKTETVQYFQGSEEDNVFQFKFTGPVVLRVEVTSWPVRQSDNASMGHLTPIGPSALFLD